VNPCIAKWVAVVPSSDSSSNFTAVALFNIGEDITFKTSTSFSDLNLPNLPTVQYRVTDIWTGVVEGVFSGDQDIVIENLRPHASRLFQVTLDQ
jgi:hypothetical protein